jgi:hypothetical protein
VPLLLGEGHLNREASHSARLFGGRRFVGHPQAGERRAVIYTLLGSCRRHGLNPFNCLKDLFTRLPAAKITETKAFTAAAWAKAKAKEQVVSQSA